MHGLIGLILFESTAMLGIGKPSYNVLHSTYIKPCMHFYKQMSSGGTEGEKNPGQLGGSWNGGCKNVFIAVFYILRIFLSQLIVILLH